MLGVHDQIYVGTVEMNRSGIQGLSGIPNDSKTQALNTILKRTCLEETHWSIKFFSDNLYMLSLESWGDVNLTSVQAWHASNKNIQKTFQRFGHITFLKKSRDKQIKYYALIIKVWDFNSIISETTKITLKDDKN